MRRIFILMALVAVAAPLHAQRSRKHDRDKITVEELADYGSQNMLEVIPKARPAFFLPNLTSSLQVSEQAMSGTQKRLLVFIGTQEMGDSSTLAYYKASDVQEVRYYRPGNALSPQSAGTAFVIQLVLKDLKKP